MTTLLVTRPAGEAQATGAALTALGHQVVLAPMLTIVFREAALPPGPFDRLVVTSGNALAALAGQPALAPLLALPLAAVGRRTAQAARAFGFADVIMAGRDVAGLLAHGRSAWPAHQRVLYLAGADHTMDLAAALAPEGHAVEVAIVYDAVETERFAVDAALALRQRRIDAVLHYSARTAQAFLACCEGTIPLARTELRHLCLSGRVADVLVSAGVHAVEVAARPDEEALFALIGG
jgi:uroporphyrinogen-III synthase